MYRKQKYRLLVEIIEASRRIHKLGLRGMETGFGELVWHLIDGNDSRIVAGGNHSIGSSICTIGANDDTDMG